MSRIENVFLCQCVSDCVYKKTGAVTESGQLNKDKLKEMTDKVEIYISKAISKLKQYNWI